MVGIVRITAKGFKLSANGLLPISLQMEAL
jgi:hypothetical protein